MMRHQDSIRREQKGGEELTVSESETRDDGIFCWTGSGSVVDCFSSADDVRHPPYHHPYDGCSVSWGFCSGCVHVADDPGSGSENAFSCLSLFASPSPSSFPFSSFLFLFLSLFPFPCPCPFPSSVWDFPFRPQSRLCASPCSLMGSDQRRRRTWPWNRFSSPQLRSSDFLLLPPCWKASLQSLLIDLHTVSGSESGKPREVSTREGFVPEVPSHLQGNVDIV